MSFQQFSDDLNSFLSESGVSQLQMSKELGVSQSQISDWKNGKGVRLSKNAKRVRDFIDNHRNSSKLMLPSSLQLAIHKFCNGNIKKFEKLELIINALDEMN